MNKFSRRCFATFLAASPVMVLAHSGHGAARVSADAKVKKLTDTHVIYVLTVLNLGSNPVTLNNVTAKGAKTRPILTGSEIAGFDSVQIEVLMTFANGVPNVFTAYMDFADHSSSPVLIMT